ncbi:transposase [uncultured Draconibacterium sp.]|uniref:transposase n=1 Tax=uncultured Draconibacterium sp. TaxID=1573823 RepID=UPI0032606A12
MKTTPLEYGNFYHIYNRGINGCNLFKENENYEYFLHLYEKYISPVADTYAWVLMKNHFHFLVKIKSVDELNLQGFQNLEGIQGTNRNRANQQFSNLFNAYTKAINKRFNRTGSLFEHPFKRIQVTNNKHLKYLVYYIHHNPIHHEFCEHFLDYPWSSYLTVVSPKATKLRRYEVLRWFDDKTNFEKIHSQQEIQKFNELDIYNSGDL